MYDTSYQVYHVPQECMSLSPCESRSCFTAAAAAAEGRFEISKCVCMRCHSPACCVRGGTHTFRVPHGVLEIQVLRHVELVGTCTYHTSRRKPPTAVIPVYCSE